MTCVPLTISAGTRMPASTRKDLLAEVQGEVKRVLAKNVNEQVSRAVVDNKVTNPHNQPKANMQSQCWHFGCHLLAMQHGPCTFA
jgi:hypothetical protein